MNTNLSLLDPHVIESTPQILTTSIVQFRSKRLFFRSKLCPPSKAVTSKSNTQHNHLATFSAGVPPHFDMVPPTGNPKTAKANSVNKQKHLPAPKKNQKPIINDTNAASPKSPPLSTNKHAQNIASSSSEKGKSVKKSKYANSMPINYKLCQTRHLPSSQGVSTPCSFKSFRINFMDLPAFPRPLSHNIESS